MRLVSLRQKMAPNCFKVIISSFVSPISISVSENESFMFYFSSAASRHPVFSTFLACLATVLLYLAHVTFKWDHRHSAVYLPGVWEPRHGPVRELRVRWVDEQPEFSLFEWKRCNSCHRLKRVG